MLGTPPAFILSQDQTLMLKSFFLPVLTGFCSLSFRLQNLLFLGCDFFNHSFLIRFSHLSEFFQSLSSISMTLGIFRVALLFICQGTVCCCVPQQLCYLITCFLLCQQLFSIFYKIYFVVRLLCILNGSGALHNECYITTSFCKCQQLFLFFPKTF